MRTTLDLPDEVFRQVKAKAALEGASLKDLLTRYIQNGLRQPVQAAGGAAKRSRLPVIPKRGDRVIPNLSPELQARMQVEEDLGKLSRSFGR